MHHCYTYLPYFFQIFPTSIKREITYFPLRDVWPPGGQTENRKTLIFNRKILTLLANMYTDFQKSASKIEWARAFTLDGQTDGRKDFDLCDLEK